jgi:hypothetical protein
MIRESSRFFLLLIVYRLVDHGRRVITSMVQGNVSLVSGSDAGAVMSRMWSPLILNYVLGETVANIILLLNWLLLAVRLAPGPFLHLQRNKNKTK